MKKGEFKNKKLLYKLKQEKLEFFRQLTLDASNGVERDFEWFGKKFRSVDLAKDFNGYTVVCWNKYRNDICFGYYYFKRRRGRIAPLGSDYPIENFRDYSNIRTLHIPVGEYYPEYGSIEDFRKDTLKDLKKYNILAIINEITNT